MLNYGPSVASAMKNFRVAENHLCGNLKFHQNTPLWHNVNILIANRPLDFRPWASKGIRTVGDLFSDKGMLSFQDLCHFFGLSGSSFFFYFQVRSALKSHNVPLGAGFPIHPVIEWTKSSPTRRFVSTIYSKLSGQQRNLPVFNAWKRDFFIYRMKTYLETLY